MGHVNWLDAIERVVRREGPITADEVQVKVGKGRNLNLEGILEGLGYLIDDGRIQRVGDSFVVQAESRRTD